MAAREACLQDLGYSEDGRKTMLVNRFAPPRTYEEDSSFESTVLIPLKSSSDESHASMPLKMPIRKASMEEIQPKIYDLEYSASEATVITRYRQLGDFAFVKCHCRR